MFAWIENSRVRDLVSDPSVFTPEIAALYNTEVPQGIVQGATLVDDVWTNPEVIVPEFVAPEPVVVVPPTVSIITYKMLFSSAERIATKNSVDEVIIDLMELTNDPRITVVDLSLASVGEALDYMTSIGILAEGRKAEILLGVIR
jgi:hypothetical protein